MKQLSLTFLSLFLLASVFSQEKTDSTAKPLVPPKTFATEHQMDNGYYDLITPFFDAEYTFSRHGIDQSRISMKYYEAGHMMYVHEEDLKALNRDMRTFLEEQL